jgi:hypothetical protein
MLLKACQGVVLYFGLISIAPASEYPASSIAGEVNNSRLLIQVDAEQPASKFQPLLDAYSLTLIKQLGSGLYLVNCSALCIQLHKTSEQLVLKLQQEDRVKQVYPDVAKRVQRR